MGIIKMKLPIEDLEKTKRKRKPSKMVTRQNRQTIKTELDLRGYRYEEAVGELDQYIEPFSAIMNKFILFMVKALGHFKSRSKPLEET